LTRRCSAATGDIVIRGGAFSAFLHGSLLALLLFGLPHFLFLTEDEMPAEPKGFEVAPATPELAAAIDKAAARPLAEILAAAGGRGLLTDAINTESDEGQRSKLQSAAGSSPLMQSTDKKIDEQSQTPRQSTRDSIDAQSAVDHHATNAQSPSEQAARQRSMQETSTSIVLMPQQRPVEPAASAAIEPSSQLRGAKAEIEARKLKDAHAAESENLPAASQRQSPAVIAQSDATQAQGPASGSQIAPASAPISGAALLAQGDAVARSLQPLVQALPRLDETIGEIIAAQARSPAQAVAAAESAPALQQSISRMASAAEQGYAHAQFNLAEIFLTGNGQPRDIETGLRYLQRASLNGYVPAQLLSAALAAEGGVRPRDLAKAHAWLSAATDQGSKQASEARERIERQMTLQDDLRARQRRSQLRQVFVLSNPKPDDRIQQPPREDQLRVATTLGNVESVYVLLAQGADADKSDGDGRTATIEAAWRGYAKILNALIEQGADPRAVDSSGKNALMWAAINGHAQVAERLIVADMPLNAQDSEGMTALMRAAWNGHAEVVRLLLQKRANPAVRDRSGKTALDYATQARQNEVVRLLQNAPPRG